MIGVEIKYRFAGIKTCATVMDKILVATLSGTPPVHRYLVRQQNDSADIIRPEEILEIIEPQ
jgi:hypothetical protein